MPSAAIADFGLPRRSATWRSIRKAWAAYGQMPAGAGSTWMVRVSSRPCARSLMVCWTGTSRQGRASRASNSFGWLSLTPVKI